MYLRERAGGGVKPGAENGPNILPEPPTESEGLPKGSAQALVGSAGYARYSCPKRSGRFVSGQVGWYREGLYELPSLRWSVVSSVCRGRELLREEAPIWRSSR